MAELMTALWIYARVQSPFLVACSYGLIKRFDKVASPYLVAPSIVGICGLFYFNTFPGADFPPFFSHLIAAAFFILSAYFLLFLKFGYSKPDALVLSLLTMMAIDELWQTPFNVSLWTQSLHNLEVGLTTGAWNLMSIPLLGYFLYRIHGRPKLAPIAKALLIVCLCFTASSLLFPPDLVYDYLLVLPWFTFFLVLFQTCKPVQTHKKIVCRNLAFCINVIEVYCLEFF